MKKEKKDHCNYYRPWFNEVFGVKNWCSNKGHDVHFSKRVSPQKECVGCTGFAPYNDSLAARQMRNRMKRRMQGRRPKSKRKRKRK